MRFKVALESKQAIQKLCAHDWTLEAERLKITGASLSSPFSDISLAAQWGGRKEREMTLHGQAPSHGPCLGRVCLWDLH